MGTHPIFESDFDCLTENMYLGRFVRDAEEATNWDDKFWYPPKSQVGTPWMPETDATDEKLNLGKVEVLFYLFMVQTIFAGLGMLGAFFDKSEQADKKSKSSGGLTNLTGLLLGVFGMCAILYNCRQFLMVTIVCNFIVIIGACIMAIFIIIGILAAMSGEYSCVALLCSIMCSLIIIGLSVAFQIAMLALSFPFIQEDV